MSKETAVVLERYTGNPILLPQKDSAWQSLNVSNAAATVHDGKVVLLYRAEGEDRRFRERIRYFGATDSAGF